MKAFHAAVGLFALASLAALPACSNWNGSSGQTSSAAPAAQQELSPGMVRQVQTALQQQGDYKGNIDGVWGPATQQAVATYQQQHNMSASGQLTPSTLASLNVAANGSGGQSSGSAPAQTAPPQQQSSNNNAAPTSLAPQPGQSAQPSASNAQPASGGTATQ